MTSIFLFLLTFHQLGPVEASLGSMGFMKLKQIQGGFNGDVIRRLPPVTSNRIKTSRRRRLLPKPAAAVSDKTATTTTKTTTKTTTTAPTTSSLARIALPDSITAEAPPQRSPSRLSTREQVAETTQESVVFDNRPGYRYNGIIIGTNVAGFLLSMLLRGSSWNKHYHVDLLGSGAFALAALPALRQATHDLASAASKTGTYKTIAVKNSERIQYTSFAVIAWSTKLAAYLLMRVVDQGGESRLDAIMSSAFFCAGFWAYSALWGILCGLPYSVGLTSSNPGNKKFLRTGMSLFLAGWIIETVSDAQKWIFKHSPQGDDAFCNAGLWSLSQHPNWFGDLMLWIGLFVANAPALVEKPQKKGFWHKVWAFRRVALAALGPWFLWRLFDQEANGRMLSAELDARREKYGYGKNPKYTQYIDNTPLLVPKVFHIKSIALSFE